MGGGWCWTQLLGPPETLGAVLAPPEELLEPSDLCGHVPQRFWMLGVALQAFLFLLGEVGGISRQSGRVVLFSGRTSPLCESPHGEQVGLRRLGMQGRRSLGTRNSSLHECVCEVNSVAGDC